MKLILGRFHARPGKRQAYLDAAQHHLEETRREEGCVFFHLLPMPDHPDGMVLCEGFVSEEAHRRHEDTDRMRALWAVGPQLLAQVEIHEMTGDATLRIEKFE